MEGSDSRLKIAWVGSLTTVLLLLAVLNFQQRRVYQLPDDGVSWVDSSQGIIAWIVAPGSPADRAGIRAGDTLRAVGGTATKHAVEADRAIFRSGVWSEVAYDLVRQAQPFQAKVVLGSQPKSDSLRRCLDLLGLSYLLVGVLVLIRARATSQSLHIYLFCLASFVLYSFSYTGKLDTLDWSVYWLNVVALVLQPTLFLHFCLRLTRQESGWHQPAARFTLAYLPAGLLLVLHVLVATKVLILSLPLLTLRWLLDRVELIYLAACFLGGAILLKHSQRRIPELALRNQLKWLARGTFLATLPFTALYALPYSLGYLPPAGMALSAFSLFVLPLGLVFSFPRVALPAIRPLHKAAESPL